MFYQFKKIMIAGIFVLSVVGCTQRMPLGYEAQSRFTYPSSNVMPLGNVIGKASGTVVYNNNINSLVSELKKKAIDDALSKKSDANILLDYFITREDTVFLSARTIEISVEGQAAHDTVGKQDIK